MGFFWGALFTCALQIGRYWTKEERKKHLEKSRERKQRQEILQASRNVEECAEKVHSATIKKVSNNIDNMAKKHKSKKMHKESCDNFNVQDVLVHGPKVANSNSKMVGLLSVTTV